MTLFDGVEGKSYKVLKIDIDDEELVSFLFTLGCYSGEFVTLLRKDSNSCMIVVKDARYNIDKNLASLIEIVG